MSRVTYAAYKHREVRQFKVGRFVFKDHILRLESAKDEEDFLRASAGLLPIDRHQIVKLKNVENEIPLSNMTHAVRGPSDTGRIKDVRDRMETADPQDELVQAAVQALDEKADAISEPEPESPNEPETSPTPAVPTGIKLTGLTVNKQ